MKKYWLLLLLFVFPIGVKASSVSISCSPETVTINGTISCTIAGNSTTPINGISGSITIGSGLSYVSYSKGSGWEGSLNTSNYLLSQYISSANAKTGYFSVGTVVLKVNEAKSSYTVGFNNGEFSDTDYNVITLNNASDNVFIADSDNSLSSLTINNGTLSPTFNSNTLNYTVSNYENSSIIIGATASSSKATITGNGTKTVNYGSNTFSIVVTAQSGATKTYKIIVNRIDIRNSDATLSALSITSGTLSPTFNSNTLNYTVSNFASDTITINATANNSKSTVTGTGKKTVSTSTTFSIVVKAENGTTKTYKISVQKVVGDDLKLQYLVLSNATINYSDDVNVYNVNVTNNVTYVVINAVAKNTYSTVSGTGSKNLTVGKNTFNINISAQNGNQRIITINITRAEASSSSTTISGIKTLTISNSTFNFDSNTLNYDLTVDATANALDIDYEANPNYSVVVTGNNNLKMGNNIVTIKVINQLDNSIKTYTLNVQKGDTTSSSLVDNSSNSGFNIPFIIVSIICVVETIALVIIMQKRKQEKNNSVENQSNPV